MGKAIYLFCLARPALLPELQMAGLDPDTPIFKEDLSNVTAVLCEVPLDEFSGPSAETRLQDLAWVGPRAVRHGEVIEHATQYSPVLPARFGTLFSSIESLRRLVKSNLAQINDFLDWVTDKDEWAVKVLLSRAEVRDRLVSEKFADQSEVLATLSQGMRYFKEQQIKAAVEKEIGSSMKAILKAATIQLTESSADWHRREVVFRAQEGSEVETVANWAFLVDRTNEEDFKSQVYRANAEYSSFGLSFELSGPWPPYSFTPALGMEVLE
jgi:hypothetical protein